MLFAEVNGETVSFSQVWWIQENATCTLVDRMMEQRMEGNVLSLDQASVADLGGPDLSLVGIKTFLQAGVSCWGLCYTEIANVHSWNEKPGPKGQLLGQGEKAWSVICLPFCTVSRSPFVSFAGS